MCLIVGFGCVNLGFSAVGGGFAGLVFLVDIVGF